VDARTRELDLATQRWAAADRLARGGERAEALRLALPAYSALMAACAPRPDHETADETTARLTQAMRDLPALSLESEVTDAHEQLLDDVLDASRALHHELTRGTPRARRLYAAGIGLALTAVLAIGFVVDRRTVTVNASATVGLDFSPERAIDGDQKTDWLLPDHQTGWIDVMPKTPRLVRQIQLLNAKNSPGGDRGVKDFHLEIHADGRLVTTLRGAFPSAGPRPQWRTFDVSVERVERVRVVVDSFYGLSAGLAEIILK
jgi:hypothetical protein